ncbi:hypothetical protein C8A05DRAFT_12357 [Staphylotrichum tortipilum]|uniref:Ketoreductase domain-containing protein n=1 Tax=Staphylotrichum tortipilum TaxID=2831512 RepID=A0AAN6RXA7_9PEZI|nr:hypothetical protein C8A05DRAFT_12357 [Staphylotrichum longicolle]
MNPANPNPYKLPDDAVWLITGCSSGIGRALATLIASKPNHRLVATARNPADLSYLPDSPSILKLPLDVTSPSSVSEAFTTARARGFHPLDIVINNAGYSLSGDTASATEEETHQEMETLFFGTARVTTHAVEGMRPRMEGDEGEGGRGGVVFNMSSLAGLCGFPGHAYYHAGKFAVEGFSESVAREVHPEWNGGFCFWFLWLVPVLSCPAPPPPVLSYISSFNICIVEPSGVKTNFEGHSKARTRAHPAYAGADMPARRLEAYVNMGIKSGVGMLEPDAVAEAIYTVASRGERIPLRLPLGAVAWKMARAKFEGLVQEWEGLKEISGMGQPL